MLDPIRSSLVIVADDHLLRGAAMAALLTLWLRPRGFDVTSTSSVDVFEDRSGADLTLCVLNVGTASLEGETLLLLIAKLRRAYPFAHLVVTSDLTKHAEAACAACLGLQAFIPTSGSADLVRGAIAFVLAGGTYFPREALLRPTETGEDIHRGVGQLTVRQEEVLAGLRQGHSNKTISRDLNMSEATVKVHVRLIMRKLGAVNRTQAALFGADHAA